MPPKWKELQTGRASKAPKTIPKQPSQPKTRRNPFPHFNDRIEKDQARLRLGSPPSELMLTNSASLPALNAGPTVTKYSLPNGLVSVKKEGKHHTDKSLPTELREFLTRFEKKDELAPAFKERKGMNGYMVCKNPKKELWEHVTERPKKKLKQGKAGSQVEEPYLKYLKWKYS